MLTLHFFFFPSVKNLFSPWSCPSLSGAVLCPWFWKLWCVFTRRAKDFSGVQAWYDNVLNRFISCTGTSFRARAQSPHCVRCPQHRAGDFPAQGASPQAHSQGELPSSFHMWHWYVTRSPNFLRGTLGYTFPWINYNFLGKLHEGKRDTEERKIN